MNTDALYGPYEQLQPAAWPLGSSGSQLGESYRRCCTSLVWVGEALAMRLMKAESVWSYPAFFDYVDRWVKDAEPTGNDYQREVKLYGSPPIKAMWTAYRAKADELGKTFRARRDAKDK